MERYERFTQAFRHLDLFPLLNQEDLQTFGVAYGANTLARLEEAVLASPSNGKVMFTGHRGCGKSTLLAQFSRAMQEQKLFVVFLSIADLGSNLSRDSLYGRLFGLSRF